MAAYPNVKYMQPYYYRAFPLLLQFKSQRFANHFFPDLVKVHTHNPKAMTPTPPNTIIKPSIQLSFYDFISKEC